MQVLFGEEANDTENQHRITGVVVAPVVDNIDADKTGIVQVRIPWGSSQVINAPVATPAAGKNRGLFFIPKPGDNVLLAFEDGDSRRPFVIGVLWGGTDTAPIEEANQADTQQVIRTETGQEIRIDEAQDSVTITTDAGQKIECTQEGVSVYATGGGEASLSLNSDGTVELSSSQEIKFKAPSITIEAQSSLKMTSSGQTEIRGGPGCSIDAQMVRINS
jgi:uncharacterized protein involved in type VI secretion and phage assembly